jgi:hypothetical protein
MSRGLKRLESSSTTAHGDREIERLGEGSAVDGVCVCVCGGVRGGRRGYVSLEEKSGPREMRNQGKKSVDRVGDKERERAI